MDLQARAQAAEARAVAAERRAAAAGFAPPKPAREAEAPPAAPTAFQGPRAAPRPATSAAAADPGHAGLAPTASRRAPRRGVGTSTPKSTCGGALKAAGDRVTAASLEERAREAARAIGAAVEPATEALHTNSARHFPSSARASTRA